MKRKILFSISILFGLLIAAGALASTSPKGCETDTTKNGEYCAWSDGGKSWCGGGTLTCAVEPTGSCPANPPNGSYAFGCSSCSCSLSCNSGYTVCGAVCNLNCVKGSHCSQCTSCPSNNCTACDPGYSLSGGACVLASLQLSSLSNVNGYVMQVASPTLTLDGSGNQALSGDLQLLNNKSIALTAVGTTTLLVGNYNGGTSFTYGTGDIASIAVEGDVKGNRLCIQEDCKADWSAVGGTSGWSRTNPYLYLTNSGDNVGVGVTNPAIKLDVNGAIGTTGGYAYLPLSANAVTTYNGGVFSWASTNNAYTGAVDTGLSRGSAAKVYVGNGTAGNYSGTLIAGNVGIGTTNPTAALQTSSLLATGGVTVSLLGGSGTRMVVTDNTGALSNQAIPVGLPTGTTGQTIYYNGSWLATSNLYNNGTNIGIGTTNPLQQLHSTGYVRGDTGFCIGTSCITSWPAGAVTSVSNSDTTLTISPTTGAVVASLNLAKANSWSGAQTFGANTNFPSSGIWNTVGNVGIGITAPTAKLHVVGTSYLNGQITTSLSGSGNRCLYVDASGNVSAKGVDCGTATGGDNMGDHSATQNIKLNSYWLSGDGGNEGIFVKSDGNVGVGTTNPVTLVDAERTNAGGDVALNLQNNSTAAGSTATITVGGSGSLNSYLQHNTNTGVLTVGNEQWPFGSNRIDFTVRNSSAAFVTPLSVVSTGNVGVGTTNPTAALQTTSLLGTSAATFSLLGGAGTRMVVTDNSGTLSTQAIPTGVSSGTDRQTLYYNSGWVATSNLSNDGTNVGIGTTNPVALVHSFSTSAANYIAERISNDTTAPQFLYKKSRGSVGAQTAVQSGDVILHIAGQGYDSSSYQTSATLRAFAGENWTASARGSYLSFHTTANGGTTISEKLRITGDGNVGIGATAPKNLLTVQTGIDDLIPALGSNGGKLALLNNGNYGLLEGVIGNGNAFLQAQRVDATATAYNILLQPNGGNVGVGTTNPSSKLTVNGDTWIGTHAYINGSLVARSTLVNDSASYLTIGGGTSGYTYFSGNVGIGTTNPTAALQTTSLLGTSAITFSLLGGSGTRMVVTDNSGTLSTQALPTSLPSGTAGQTLYYNGGWVAGSGLYNNGTNVGIGTTAPGAYRLNVSGDTNITGNLNVTGTITANKLTVNTVDPLYRINGANYATFGASVAGGVKEEYIGRLKIENKIAKDYEAIIDFDKVEEGSDLWVWRNVVDFHRENVEVFITPYGQFAKAYYIISGNQLIFRSDKPTEIVYRLVGKRFDWQAWPTKSDDQESLGLEVK